MGFGGGNSKGVRSDINVTPLVDVCLVLLIIFMVMMPVIMRDITLEIPRKAEPNEDQMPSEMPIVVEVAIDGTIKLNEKSVNKFQLAEELTGTLKNKREKLVFVSFAEDLPYGEAVSIMDVVKGSGPEGAVKVALKMKEEGKDGPAGSPASGQ